VWVANAAWGPGGEDGANGTVGGSGGEEESGAEGATCERGCAACEYLQDGRRRGGSLLGAVWLHLSMFSCRTRAAFGSAASAASSSRACRRRRRPPLHRRRRSPPCKLCLKASQAALASSARRSARVAEVCLKACRILHCTRLPPGGVDVTSCGGDCVRGGAPTPPPPSAAVRSCDADGRRALALRGCRCLGGR